MVAAATGVPATAEPATAPGAVPTVAPTVAAGVPTFAAVCPPPSPTLTRSPRSPALAPAGPSIRCGSAALSAALRTAPTPRVSAPIATRAVSSVSFPDVVAVRVDPVSSARMPPMSWRVAISAWMSPTRAVIPLVITGDGSAGKLPARNFANGSGLCSSRSIGEVEWSSRSSPRCSVTPATGVAI
ncbi:hypothetical protein FMM06_04180 [Glacieibacterium frigidum]|uniref:Uncharacterized protein n=1 Tax=Glacieibacterium frigidum TaxID=2593303 RepID=A0A552UGP1_9SPHN|nr:hypothetical protein FMM06_04180 [Glacieibacterium frigidum]